MFIRAGFVGRHDCDKKAAPRRPPSRESDRIIGDHRAETSAPEDCQQVSRATCSPNCCCCIQYETFFMSSHPHDVALYNNICLLKQHILLGSIIVWLVGLCYFLKEIDLIHAAELTLF